VLTSLKGRSSRSYVDVEAEPQCFVPTE
jgi:hypothetical protein